MANKETPALFPAAEQEKGLKGRLRTPSPGPKIIKEEHLVRNALTQNAKFPLHQVRSLTGWQSHPTQQVLTAALPVLRIDSYHHVQFKATCDIVIRPDDAREYLARIPANTLVEVVSQQDILSNTVTLECAPDDPTERSETLADERPYTFAGDGAVTVFAWRQGRDLAEVDGVYAIIETDPAGFIGPARIDIETFNPAFPSAIKVIKSYPLVPGGTICEDISQFSNRFPGQWRGVLHLDAPAALVMRTARLVWGAPAPCNCPTARVPRGDSVIQFYTDGRPTGPIATAF